jgi:hypothetical protein
MWKRRISARANMPSVLCDMKQTLLAMAMLPMLAAVAQASPIDWQAELDRYRALREQMAPLLQAGVGISSIARSGAAARRCVWIERRAMKHDAHPQSRQP